MGRDCTQPNIHLVAGSYTVLHFNGHGGCVLIYIYKMHGNDVSRTLPGTGFKNMSSSCL